MPIPPAAAAWHVRRRRWPERGYVEASAGFSVAVASANADLGREALALFDSGPGYRMLGEQSTQLR